MYGYTGEFEGRPVSVQATGMGCPSVAIVVEELVQLGVKRLLRVGTCGGLQPDLKLGDLIVAVSAIAADQTAQHLVDEPHVPTADWEPRPCRGAPAELGKPVRVGPIVSSDLLQPRRRPVQRWSDRGVLAVEMEAAVLFDASARSARSRPAACHRRDVVIEGEFVRISDEEEARGGRPDDGARAARWSRALISKTVFLVSPASANGSTGKLLEIATSPRPVADRRRLEAPGRPTELARPRG